VDTPVNAKIHGAFILLSFLIFFPIGIILLIIRYVLHAKYNHLRIRDYKITGHALLTLFGLMMIILFSGTTSGRFAGFIGFFVLLVIPAIIFYAVSSSLKKKMVTLYKMYYWLVIEQGNGSIAALSQSTGVSPDKVLEDIRYMIATGQLPNASLNGSGNIVLLGQPPK